MLDRQCIQASGFSIRHRRAGVQVPKLVLSGPLCRRIVALRHHGRQRLDAIRDMEEAPHAEQQSAARLPGPGHRRRGLRWLRRLRQAHVQRPRPPLITPGANVLGDHQGCTTGPVSAVRGDTGCWRRGRELRRSSVACRRAERTRCAVKTAPLPPPALGTVQLSAHQAHSAARARTAASCSAAAARRKRSSGGCSRCCGVGEAHKGQRTPV